MLEANKNRLFETIFAIYNRNLLKRRFNSCRVAGFDLLLKYKSNIPQIIYCNHTSWWDGLVAFQISRIAKLNSYVMMEEKQLRRFFLFRKLGAFSIDRENPRRALESIRYSVELLKSDPQRTLWIFPQGEIVSSELRPIFFYPGLSKIVEKVGQCRVTSLSLKYEFLGNFKPEIFVRIDEPELIQTDVGFNSRIVTLNLAEKMTQNSDALKNDVVHNRLQSYRSII